MTDVQNIHLQANQVKRRNKPRNFIKTEATCVAHLSPPPPPKRTHARAHTYLRTHGGTAVTQWLRCCATHQKVTGSISAGVIGIFH